MNFNNKHEVGRASGSLPLALRGCVTDIAELRLLKRLEERSDVACLWVKNSQTDKLVGYAVFGPDDLEHLTVYAAHSFEGPMTAIMIRSIFGAAQVLNTPMRVHTEKVQAFARLLGSSVALAGVDSDSIPMGIFANGKR